MVLPSTACLLAHNHTEATKFCVACALLPSAQKPGLDTVGRCRVRASLCGVFGNRLVKLKLLILWEPVARVDLVLRAVAPIWQFRREARVAKQQPVTWKARQGTAIEPHKIKVFVLVRCV